MSYIEKFRSLLTIYNVVNSKLIRVGNKYSDGGYVLPDKLLVDVDLLYNYGVGNEITFEEDFLERYPYKVVRSFDHTIEAYPYTDKIVDYHKEGLAPSKTDDCDSFENHVVRFNDIDRKILLKIDVEGAEYEYFNSSDFKIIDNKVYGILLEIHWINKNLDDFIRMLEKLTIGFACVYVHANNCGGLFKLDGYILPDVIEVCLVNRSYFELDNFIDTTSILELSVKCNSELDEFFLISDNLQNNHNYYSTCSVNFIQEIKRFYDEVVNQDIEINSLRRDELIRDSEITRLHDECANRDIEINSLRRDGLSRDNEITRLHDECANRDIEINSLRRDGLSRDSEINRLDHECANRDTEIVRLQSKCSSQSIEMDRLRNEYINYDSEIHRLHSECAVRDMEINRLHSEIHLRNAEIERLNNHIGSIYATLSWKITTPLRVVEKALKDIILFPRRVIIFIKQIIKKIIIKIAKKIMVANFIRRIGKSYLKKHPQLTAKIKRKMVEKGLYSDPYMPMPIPPQPNDLLLIDSLDVEQVRQQYGNDVANVYQILTKNNKK